MRWSVWPPSVKRPVPRGDKKSKSSRSDAGPLKRPHERSRKRCCGRSKRRRSSNAARRRSKRPRGLPNASNGSSNSLLKETPSNRREPNVNARIR